MAEQLHHLQRVVFLIAGVFLAAAITACPAHAQQPPPVPQAFYGSVEVNAQPAAVGSQIEARGTGVKVGILGNPLSVTVAGRYGGRPIAEPKLGVQGDLEDGVLIEFYVDGVKAECARPGGAWQNSYPFTSGVVTELNLRVSPAAQVTGTPTPTSQSGSTAGTATPTATVRARLAAGDPPTATRGSAGATLTPTPAQITMSTQSPVAALATATTQPAGVIVSTPTGLAAPSDPGTPTSLPAAQARPPAATPSATPEPVAPIQQSTLTPVLMARAPAATSEPILKASTPATVARAVDRSASLPEDPQAARPLNLAMLTGGAVLALAIAAGAVIIRVRSRPR